MMAADPLAVRAFTEADRAIMSAVREVVATDIAPRARSTDETSEFPDGAVQALAARGLGCIPLPESLGGRGGTMLAYAAAIEEIAAACGSTSTVYMTQLHCAHPIFLAGSDEQRARLIPALCRAEIYGSLAVTETEAGSDVAGLRTVARRDGDEYVISGAKTFITNGDRAEVVLLFATVDRSRGRDGITPFLLERSRDGFTSGSPMKKMGMHGSSTCELYFDDCRVPASARLGEEGSGFSLSMQAVTTSRISAAAQGVGLARAALEHACAWARARGLLDDRDAQDRHFRLAEMRTDVAAARALLYEVAQLVDAEDGDPTGLVAMAKLHCTATAVATADTAVELLGADGDDPEHDVERVLRDAKVTEIYDGTNQIQRILIARDIRRQFLGGDLA
jgi:alkylation response protein AidB-like acyl-CoA dehydrogenase